MRSQNYNDRPTMTWIEVTDADGRTRLEARWSVPTHTSAATAHAA